MNAKQYTSRESRPVLRSDSEGGVKRHGFTLIELVIAVAASTVILLISGVLLESGQKSWERAFRYANSKTQLDALTATITFGQLGRQSNKLDYKLYNLNGSRFMSVIPPAAPGQIAEGEAVEFHYWADEELNSDIMDTSITGNTYALFYLDDNKLMLNTGPYPPGGVDAVGYLSSGPEVISSAIAENVISLKFSHTTRNLEGKGRGCVRLEMTLRDPDDHSLTTVTAATLMRNVWP
jgi:prepilin-type N-terminal cleavage/methylation domain-containing protein